MAQIGLKHHTGKVKASFSNIFLWELGMTVHSHAESLLYLFSLNTFSDCQAFLFVLKWNHLYFYFDK